MLDNDDTTTPENTESAAPPVPDTPEGTAPAKKAPARRTAAKKAPAKKAAPRKSAATKAAEADTAPADASAEEALAPAKRAPARKRAAAKTAAPAAEVTTDVTSEDASPAEAAASNAPMVLFQPPEKKTAPPRKRTAKKAVPAADAAGSETPEQDAPEGQAPAKAPKDKSEKGEKSGKGKKKGGKSKKAKAEDGELPDEDAEVGAAPLEQAPASQDSDDADDTDDESGETGEGGPRRRRRRGGRRRRKPSEGGGGGESADATPDEESSDADEAPESAEGEPGSGGSRRRRRRRRTGEEGGGSSDDQDGSAQPRARRQRNPEDEITGVSGSTRLEAKKQRRREGREAGRRRAPIVSEAEFLARRESVDRVMVIRQHEDLTQIGVLEDKVLVEHYVARESQTSLIGNVYLGRVQNVLPSMEAAFVDIGKGRNAVLYAGEVNWSALGHKDGQQRKIESVLSSGQTILVQVTKDPVGHKGARLTGQVSLPGRFLVYVPEGNTSGISRKLPDTERHRLKTLLKEIVPDTAGVIVRTAAEGASEDELTRDVERLTARWSDIEAKVKSGKGPELLYGEPDLTLKVVRDLFTEDFAKLVVQGDDAWDLVDGYVSHVAPDLRERLERFAPATEGSDAGKDVFATYRVDEQIAKGLDRKVWLPSGGSLIIDRTEAMTVVDVNTGKFTGSGGNLEETVTKNNLEAAEEIVRQLRLRDIGGIIVVDFIDMVLESNRDLVLRRLVECLGRDRTRHQVAEVTSLGLVQMTRKRIGTGLLEAFSTDCEHCKGRGVVVHEHPVEPHTRNDDDDARGRGGRSRSGGRSRGGRGGNGQNGGQNGGGQNGGGQNGNGGSATPSPAALAGSRPPEKHSDQAEDGVPVEQEPVQTGSVHGAGPDADAEPHDVPTEQTAPPVAALVAETPEVSAEPVAPQAPEPVATPEPVSTEPRVVTSSRRRSARRPAGPPASVSDATGGAGAGMQAAPSAEPVDVPVEPAAPGHGATEDPAAQPDQPPATPGSFDDVTASEEPVAAPDPEAPDADQSEADEDLDGPDGEEAGEETDESGALSLLHVPIKRKGARKR